LVEIRETVQEILIPTYVEVETPMPAVAKTPLFAQMADDVLLEYGVPAEWLDDVRAATEDTLFAISDHLPGEAAEALLELATGGKPGVSQPSDYTGPGRVSGSAGTGKTIVALHRAVYLARTNPNARILLTTFSDTLAHALQTKLNRLFGKLGAISRCRPARQKATIPWAFVSFWELNGYYLFRNRPKTIIGRLLLDQNSVDPCGEAHGLEM
jgi:hypothetical protein